MARRRQIKLGKRLVFAAVILALLFPLTEVTLRLLGVAVDTGGPTYLDRLMFQDLGQGEVGWDEYITLGAKVYPLSSQNYNIDRTPGPKPPGVTRVVCLGDSSTIGDQVEPHEAYPQVLGRLLPHCYPGRKIEVWNFGRHGYTSYQGRLLAEQTWDRVQPDAVVFYFGANDASPAPIRADKDWARAPEWSLRLHRLFYTRSVFYRVVRNVNLAYLRRGVRQVFSDEPPTVDPHYRVAEPDFWANRDALAAHVRAAGGAFVQVSSAGVTGGQVVPGPFFLEWQPGPLDVDLRALFAPEKAGGRDPFADVVHPNAHGHRMLARTIAAKLADGWGEPACELGENPSPG
jgi:lysophospholipase L1-like esterase